MPLPADLTAAIGRFFLGAISHRAFAVTMLANLTKHQREEVLFREFTRLYVPAGRVDHHDKPDFSIHTATQGVLGVEVTELFQQSGKAGSQGQEVERIKLLEEVKQRIASGMPPVHVRVFFSPYVRLEKGNRTDLAIRLASLIETRMPPTDDQSIHLENYWRDPAIPECVLSIRITRFPWREALCEYFRGWPCADRLHRADSVASGRQGGAV